MTADAATRREFKERVYVWSRELDVDVQSLTVYVRPMARKWASCSGAGNLSFSADLLDADATLQDYVIVHELLHLSVPNHGKLWKSLMRAYLGDYESAEVSLRSWWSHQRSAIAGT